MNSLIPMRPDETDYAHLVQTDRAHTSLYTDAKIFDDEMQKIYYSTWVWVAHASEIPESGSYKTINIGQQPVVVVRDRKKNVHVLLNRCRHRAATVCEHKKVKPTVLFVLITAGVMHSMVRYVAYHHLKATENVWIKVSCHYFVFGWKSTTA